MRRELLQIDMAYRCPLSWDDLHGNENHRHCDKCNHTVTNLSEMTTAAAKEFLNQPTIGCVRFDCNKDGSVQTKEQLSRWNRFTKPLKFLAAALVYFVTLGCQQKEAKVMGLPINPRGMEATLGKPAPPPELREQNQKDKPDGESPEDKK